MPHFAIRKLLNYHWIPLAYVICELYLNKTGKVYTIKKKKFVKDSHSLISISKSTIHIPYKDVEK